MILELFYIINKSKDDYYLKKFKIRFILCFSLFNSTPLIKSA